MDSGPEKLEIDFVFFPFSDVQVWHERSKKSVESAQTILPELPENLSCPSVGLTFGKENI